MRNLRLAKNLRRGRVLLQIWIELYDGGLTSRWVDFARCGAPALRRLHAEWADTRLPLIGASRIANIIVPYL